MSESAEGNEEGQLESARTLGVLAMSPQCHDEVREQQGIPPLIKLLSN